MFAKACKMGLEGIVSKRAGSRYWSGNSRKWLKAKNPTFLREADGSQLLGEFPLEVVRAECLRCRKVGLVARFGADIALSNRKISTRNAREATPAMAITWARCRARSNRSCAGYPALPASPQARPTHAQAFCQRTTFRPQHTTTTQILLLSLCANLAFFA